LAGKYLLVRSALLALLVSVAAPVHAQHGNAPVWVRTWAAPMQTAEPSMASPNITFHDQSVRSILRIRTGGSKVRIHLSNLFGETPLHIENINVAFTHWNDQLVAGSVHPLLFHGATSVDIPAGAVAVSDALDWDVPSNSLLAISFYIPDFQSSITFHRNAYEISYVNKGNTSSVEAWTASQKVPSWYFLTGVDVQSTRQHPIVVAIGDSITEGAHTIANADHRWPDLLSARLGRNAATSDLIVLDEGIGGNRVVKDSAGPPLVSRIDRDVLELGDVRYVIVLEGINDIGRTVIPRAPNDAVTAAEIIDGYKSLIAKAHERHIRVIGATVLPFEDAMYYSTAGEAMRQELNAWIRAKGHFDNVIDFDAMIRDPQHPSRMIGRFDSGDHLHPNDDGFQMLTDAIDLRLFTAVHK